MTTTQLSYGGIPGYGPGPGDVPTPPMTSSIAAAQPVSAVAAPRLEDDGPRLVCGLLPPLVAGCLVSALVLAEGIFVFLDTSGTGGSSTGFLAGINRDTEFHRVQWSLVEGLAIGDAVASILGFLGIALAAGLAMPIRLASYRASVTTFGVGALLAWRALVGVAVLPWIGFMFAFEPSEYIRWPRWVGALLYMAFDLYLLSLLVWVVRAASYRGKILQEEFLLRLAEGSGRRLLAGPGDGSSAAPFLEVETILFFFPLESAVAFYALFAAIASFILLWTLVRTDNSGAGWALLLSTARGGTSATYWVEVFVYVISLPVAMLAVAAIVTHRQLDLASEDPEQRAVGKRCAALVLIFFVVSAFRFSLDVPVTGMALAGEDTCGLYIAGLQATSLERHPGSALHCSVAEVGILVATIVIFALDATLLVGVCRVWQRYRVAGDSENGSPLFGKGYSAYDAADIPHEPMYTPAATY